MPRLLVTGASGYLGGALVAHAARAGWEVLGTYRTHPPGPPAAPPGVRATALDVRDAGAVAGLLAREAPDAVVHTAYVQDGDAAHAVNAGGAEHVARAARAAGARLVHVSSDAIFAGAGDRPLREEDPPDPVTAYGATKAAAEPLVAAAHPDALIVRTSLLYGGPGRAPSKHETLALAVARGEADVAFFSDEIRSPVQVDDLAAALLQLVASAHAGPLHVGGADAVSRLAFARLIAAAAGEDPARLGAGRPAPPGRPRNCPLDSRRAQALLDTRLRGAREVLRAAPAPG
ncbi:MAG: dTDP-4-dehydrorhamnose reductase [Baekduia sp.]|nr:dTDP-4-dehydrorhamnose reductase [Baekduia sp.]